MQKRVARFSFRSPRTIRGKLFEFAAEAKGFEHHFKKNRESRFLKIYFFEKLRRHNLKRNGVVRKITAEKKAVVEAYANSPDYGTSKASATSVASVQEAYAAAFVYGNKQNIV